MCILFGSSLSLRAMIVMIAGKPRTYHRTACSGEGGVTAIGSGGVTAIIIIIIIIFVVLFIYLFVFTQ